MRDISPEIDKYTKIIVLLFLLILFLPYIFLNNFDLSEHSIVISNGVIRIKSQNFYVSDIESIDILNELSIDRGIKGTWTTLYSRGVCYVNDTNNSFLANVYIYNNSSPYIRINLKDSVVIYNDKDSSNTKKTYNKLIKIINKNNEADLISQLHYFYLLREKSHP